MPDHVALEGRGLHSGEPVRVTLSRAEGPVQMRAGGASARVDELSVASSAWATTVTDCSGALRLGTVEHLFAALAGLGVRDGLLVEVDGPELPILDGAATRWCDAVRALDLAPAPPSLRVVRPAVYTIGPSRYELAPGDGVDVSVRVVLDDRFEPLARWQGDPRDFEDRVAPARTFSLARDVEELTRRGLARHVDPTAVVVLAPDAVHSAGRPFTPDEPARHKLLDLLGDLYLFGGPPLGRVHVERPGHAAHARAFARARSEGILAPT